MSIQPTVKKVESFIVTGFSVRTQNSDEFNDKMAKLPRLWQQFYTSELTTNANIFGVYSNYDSDANGPYTVTVGVTSHHAHAQLSSVTIQAGNYLVFQGTGPMPTIVVETWKRVWEFFEKNTKYLRNFISDFEAYSGSDKVEIYIGLE
ncbi:MAG: effector binding domain-containing protein [Legionella sp.]|nr:effector binding domain-containing protein [Legionella sp.]